MIAATANITHVIILLFIVFVTPVAVLAAVYPVLAVALGAAVVALGAAVPAVPAGAFAAPVVFAAWFTVLATPFVTVCTPFIAPLVTVFIVSLTGFAAVFAAKLTLEMNKKANMIDTNKKSFLVIIYLLLNFFVF